ncbi:MAG TPA: hypothetical protein VIF13_06105 [Hyphomicrobium sp.]
MVPTHAKYAFGVKATVTGLECGRSNSPSAGVEPPSTNNTVMAAKAAIHDSGRAAVALRRA